MICNGILLDLVLKELSPALGETGVWDEVLGPTHPPYPPSSLIHSTVLWFWVLREYRDGEGAVPDFGVLMV